MNYSIELKLYIELMNAYNKLHGLSENKGNNYFAKKKENFGSYSLRADTKPSKLRHVCKLGPCAVLMQT